MGDMRGKLDFGPVALEIATGITALMRNLPCGHPILPAVPEIGIPTMYRASAALPRPPSTVGTVGASNEMHPVADEELDRIHKHLSHCSEYTLANLLKAGMRVADFPQIRKVHPTMNLSWGRQTHRAPELSGRAARFVGAILGIGVVYPFFGARGGVSGKN